MAEVIAALGRREARDTLAQQRPERLDRPTARGAHEGFEFGETQFDRIEIGLYGGKYRSVAPAAAISCWTPST